MITLGRHSYTGTIHEHFDPVIDVGNFTSIASDVHFYGNCEHPTIMDEKAVSSFPFFEKEWGSYVKCGSRGKITIGSDVWIGEHTIILDNVTIGDGAIIGAGSVVTKNIPPFEVWAGNAARHIRDRYPKTYVFDARYPEFDNYVEEQENSTREKLLKIKWWNWTDAEIKEHLADFKDITQFIQKYWKEET